MASTNAPAHRSVASIRPTTAANPPSPSNPHTPLRPISSTYGSPSSLRAEEECVILELGNRNLKAGFAGDALPKAVVGFGPEEQRRAGDYRRWDINHDADWRNRKQGETWGDTHELWKMDLRDCDLGLVGDKIERAVREVYTKYLLIDSRPRRMALVLSSSLPLPLLSTILDTLFANFPIPNISLFSSPVLTTLAAGLRASLVVDIGWTETVVTSIYEFREIQCHRSIRAAKRLGEEMYKMLANAIDPTLEREEFQGTEFQDIVSFEEVEEITMRIGWCKPAVKSGWATPDEGLATVKEEDELRSSIRSLGLDEHAYTDSMATFNLTSTNPPQIFKLPFSKLAEPCENALFADKVNIQDLDDEELPLHLLVYRSLLQLPVDLRSMCMARIVFVGGGSNLPGLKTRIIDEVNAIIEHQGWDAVTGRAVGEFRTNSRLRHFRRRRASEGPSEVSMQPDSPSSQTTNVAFARQEPDPIEEQIQREASKRSKPIEHGYLRAVDSMGAWAGASLVSQLKVPAISIIDREQWLQHGASGASKNSEISITAQRHSMGPGTFKAGGADRSSWTLGLWG